MNRAVGTPCHPGRLRFLAASFERLELGLDQRVAAVRAKAPITNYLIVQAADPSRLAA